MIAYEESGLSFTFPRHWIVRKFDATPAYRSLSGHGLKGVDFVCLSPDGRLYLIEVKNYRSRHRRHRIVGRSPEALAEQVGRKFSDTKRLVRIVNRALRRGWWTSLLLTWYRLHRRPRPDGHYWFWAEAERRLTERGKLMCVLWLEMHERTTDYRAALTEAMEEWVESEDHLLIADLADARGLPLSVRLL